MSDVWLPTNLDDDFTVLTTDQELLYPRGSTSRLFPHIQRLAKVNGSQSVQHCNNQLARVQPASCFEGRSLSITVRSKKFQQPIRPKLNITGNSASQPSSPRTTWATT